MSESVLETYSQQQSNKHDTGWAKGAPSEDHIQCASLHPGTVDGVSRRSQGKTRERCARGSTPVIFTQRGELQCDPSTHSLHCHRSRLHTLQMAVTRHLFRYIVARRLRRPIPPAGLTACTALPPRQLSLPIPTQPCPNICLCRARQNKRSSCWY